MNEMVVVPSWWVSEGPQWWPSWFRVPSSRRSRTLDSGNLFFLLSCLPFPLPAPWVTSEFLLGTRTYIITCQWKMELSMWISCKINYAKRSKDKRNSDGLAAILGNYITTFFLELKAEGWLGELQAVLGSNLIPRFKAGSFNAHLREVTGSPKSWGHQSW